MTNKHTSRLATPASVRQLCTDVAALAFCCLSAVAASFLSGLNFPEVNNVWHLPIALDFAGSADGPHDAYHKTFAYFVSVFWLCVKFIANDENIQRIFIWLQLSGNAALTIAIFAYLRSITHSVVQGALIASLFSFSYGLWGLTRLGYSEMYVTYATHTQFAIVTCLLGLLLTIHSKPIFAGIVLGVASHMNLFMAVWSALAAGLYLLSTERKLFSRYQILFSLSFLLTSTPVLVWVFFGTNANDEKIPLTFFESFLKGHVYAGSYPQAAIQTFALGLAAGVAALREKTRCSSAAMLGIATLCCGAILAGGALMPYLLQEPFLLLLHPLRFSSVLVLLSACCAGVLLILNMQTPEARTAAFLAVCGFLLKTPLISILGFSLLISSGKLCYRVMAFIICAGATTSLLLPSQQPNTSTLGVIAFLLLCVILASAELLPDSRNAHPVSETKAWLTRSVVGLLGCAVSIPAGPWQQAASLLALPGIYALLCPVTESTRKVSVAIALFAIVGILTSLHSDVQRLTLMLLGMLALFVSGLPKIRNFSFRYRLATAALCAIPLFLITAGLIKGWNNNFSVTRTIKQNDYIAAQQWARQSTLVGSVFFTDVKDAGFSLFSRRSSWWEPAQGAAVMWSPSFYPIWTCRMAAVNSAHTAENISEIARSSNVDYILTVSEKNASDFLGFSVAYSNPNYTILQRRIPKIASPLCPDPNPVPGREPPLLVSDDATEFGVANPRPVLSSE